VFAAESSSSCLNNSSVKGDTDKETYPYISSKISIENVNNILAKE
jgi:hypothetical protein